MKKLEAFVTVHLPTHPWFPCQVSTIALFATYLLHNDLSVATVTSTLSAVAFFHKLYGYQDPTTHFMIQKILTGANKLHKSSDLRQPIDLITLHRLTESTVHVCESNYHAVLLKAMYLLMFHAFLRIGEATKSINNLSLSNISFAPDHFVLTFTTFKHHKGPNPSITIQKSISNYCPFSSLLSYLKLRGWSPGPLFCFLDLTPIPPSTFNNYLKLSLLWAGLSNSDIKPHSFRIGAATHAATMGFTETQIKRMGRWQSNSFQKYIRIPMFKSPF